MYDYIIKNGTVVDGTGAAPKVCDIAITGDKIVKIALSITDPAKETIDASGKTVIPGFIDPHVHEEWVCFADNDYDLFLKQGVTTLVNGNCGHSVTPGPVEEVIDYYFYNGLMSFDQRDRYKKSFPKWEDFSGYAGAVAKRGANVNFVTLLGHGTIRQRVMNGALPRVPTEAEWQQIEAHIRTGMEQGMWGISFGLDYIPSRYAQMDELVRVAKIIEEYDGVCAAHLRHYIGIPESTQEFLEVGRQSGAKLQISHLKGACPEAFEIARKGIEGGVRARIDTIPRSTGHCTGKRRLIQFIMALSDELFDKGEAGVYAALKTPKGRATIKKDAYIFGGSKEEIFIVNSTDPALENRSVADIARERGIDPDECILDLIGDDQNYVFWMGGPSRSDFPKAGHEQIVVDNPYVAVGSDRIMGDIEDPYDWYELQRIGAFPVFMQMYLAKGVALQEIVRRNTTMIAEHFAIPNRGQLAEGYFADIAVLDVPNYRFPEPDQMHYKTPNMRATGVHHVFVNGTPALQNGQVKKAMSGRVLKKV